MSDEVDHLTEDPVIHGQKWVVLSLVLPESMIEKREMFYMTEFFNKISEKLGLSSELAAKLRDNYDNFKTANQTDLDAAFRKSNGENNSVVGLKVRGSYADREAADARGEHLSRVDPDMNIFVAEVGKWLPIASSIEDHIENQKYQNDQLQTLMANYKENQREKDKVYGDHLTQMKNNSGEGSSKDLVFGGMDSLRNALDGSGGLPTNIFN